jgi:hypothetical protein
MNPAQGLGHAVTIDRQLPTAARAQNGRRAQR